MPEFFSHFTFAEQPILIYIQVFKMRLRCDRQKGEHSFAAASCLHFVFGNRSRLVCIGIRKSIPVFLAQLILRQLAIRILVEMIERITTQQRCFQFLVNFCKPGMSGMRSHA